MTETVEQWDDPRFKLTARVSSKVFNQAEEVAKNYGLTIDDITTEVSRDQIKITVKFDLPPEIWGPG